MDVFFVFTPKVFYFMLPETTATSLSSTLVDTINQKFRSRGQGESERIHQAQFDLIEEGEFMHQIPFS